MCFIYVKGKFIGVKPQCYTLANSVLRISIALSIEAFLHIPLCHHQKVQKTGHYSSSEYHLCRLEREGNQELIRAKHLYLNLMMLIGSDSRIHSFSVGNVTTDPS